MNSVSFIQNFKLSGRNLYQNNFLHEISAKSLLKVYSKYKFNTLLSPYLLHVTNFNSVNKKIRLRTGCLGLESDKLRWKTSDGRFKRCDLKELDTTKNYILNCTYFINYIDKNCFIMLKIIFSQ